MVSEFVAGKEWSGIPNTFSLFPGGFRVPRSRSTIDVFSAAEIASSVMTLGLYLPRSVRPTL
jgi:hypothetical protein